MADIELACHTAAWGDDAFINALSAIESAGFKGIETTSEVVNQFEDRIEVFNEILQQHQLRLVAITTGGAQWPGLSLEEEVERNLNVARFLKSAGANILTLLPPIPNPNQPLEDEADIIPVATAYGEISRRAQELSILPCLRPDIDSLVHDQKTLEYFIEHSDPTTMKLCADVSFLALAKIPVKKFLKEYRKRIGNVHLRDLKPRSSKKKKDKKPITMQVVELGKGVLKLEEFVDALLSAEFSGWASIELEKGAKNLTQQAAHSYHYASQTLDMIL